MKITCPHCGLTGKVPEGDAGAGEPLVCPRCGGSFEPRRKPAPTEQPDLFPRDEPAAPAEVPPREPGESREAAETAPPSEPPLPSPGVSSSSPEPAPAPSAPTMAAAGPVVRCTGIPAGAVFCAGLLLVAAAAAWHLGLNLHLGRPAQKFCSDPSHFPPVLAAAGAALLLLAAAGRSGKG